MVVHDNREWVAFEQLRGSTEATTVVSETKQYGRSTKKPPPRKKSWTMAYSTDMSWNQLPSAPMETGSQLSTSSGHKNMIPPSSPSARRSRASSRDFPTETKEKALPRPDFLKRRAVSATSTAAGNTESSSSRSRARPSSRGRERGHFHTSSARSKSRGRPRDRSQDIVPPKASSRTRSVSRARSTATADDAKKKKKGSARSHSRSRTVCSTKSSSRGRSSSRSRPPPVSSNSARQRARSRSQSLTRITSPTAASPAATLGRTRQSTKPPSTARTRQEMRQSIGSGSVGSARNGCAESPRSLGDINIGRDISFGRTEPPLSSSEEKESAAKGGFMERLFGDQVRKSKPGRKGLEIEDNIRPRILLAATVYHNTATNLWITTINTNQRGVAKNPTLANKYLKAFSFASEREARESAIANAPPKMVSFSESRNCFTCNGRFAVFRRACHCRNCGVCICNTCAKSWPAKMIPATYNLKQETVVKICKGCDMLSTSFKEALLAGDYEKAVALYGTGNINLRTPFPTPNKKEEVMHPIHCAVQGGNLDIIRWLIDDHFCPIKLIRTGGGKKSKRGVDALILSSKGRSVLSIALERLKVDVMRYLVVDCCVSIFEATDLKMSLRALEAALVSLPSSKTSSRQDVEGPLPVARWDKASFDEMSEPSSLGSVDYSETETLGNSTAGNRSSRTKSSRSDSCIICFERKINCVATPCGHQVCCLQCSSNLSACPVCNNRGDFIKIFRP